MQRLTAASKERSSLYSLVNGFRLGGGFSRKSRVLQLLLLLSALLSSVVPPEVRDRRNDDVNDKDLLTLRNIFPLALLLRRLGWWAAFSEDRDLRRLPRSGVLERVLLRCCCFRLMEDRPSTLPRRDDCVVLMVLPSSSATLRSCFPDLLTFSERCLLRETPRDMMILFVSRKILQLD